MGGVRLPMQVDDINARRDQDEEANSGAAHAVQKMQSNERDDSSADWNPIDALRSEKTGSVVR